MVVSTEGERKSRSRRRRVDGEQTRARVLDAAIESILEKGYYQTSSNEIARRADVTWGTIQHQFGTREQLLLEVAKNRWRVQHEVIATAQIAGDSLEERLQSVLEVLALHYEQPASLAHLQIVLDLSFDPNTSKTTRAAMNRHRDELAGLWKTFIAQAVGDAASDADLVAFAFAALRGFLEGNLIATSIGGKASSRLQRQLLVRGVACAIREYAAEKGFEVD